jgi:hypothetical protein
MIRAHKYSQRRQRNSTGKTNRNSTTRKSRRTSNLAAQNLADCIQMFFNMLMNIRFYHWTTSSYSRHTGSGALYDSLSSLIDQFVETYMGRYQRPQFKENTTNIQVKQHNDDSILDLLHNYTLFLTHEVPKYVNHSDSDLLNIRDEILGEINKTIYLFTLK